MIPVSSTNSVAARRLRGFGADLHPALSDRLTVLQPQSAVPQQNLEIFSRFSQAALANGLNSMQLKVSASVARWKNAFLIQLCRASQVNNSDHYPALNIET